MARRQPTSETLRLLYARSGNQCAFSECTQPIFNDDNLYVAELCHIEAANEKGSRYNPNQTDIERCSAENLLFLCGRHHKEIDYSQRYDVTLLKEMKQNHESKFFEKNIVASKEMVQQIETDIKTYWNRLKEKEYNFEEFKIKLDFDKEIMDLFDEIESNVQSIKKYCDYIATSDENLYKETLEFLKKIDISIDKLEQTPYYDNPLVNRNWELHNIGRTNSFSHIELSIKQMKVRVLEIMLKNTPNSDKIQQQILDIRTAFESKYDNSYFVD